MGNITRLRNRSNTFPVRARTASPAVIITSSGTLRLRRWPTSASPWGGE